MEGGQEMNDILLGTIIGGTIGVAGSAVVAWIQEHYAQQRQSTQIRNDKNREVIGRIIGVRARYLDPLSTQLGKLQAALSDFQDKLLEVIVPYTRGVKHGERVVDLQAVKKQVLIQQLKSVDSTLLTIETARTRVQETAFNATDNDLRQLLKALLFKTYELTKAYHKMQLELAASEEGHGLVYDFDQVIEPMTDVYIGISSAHRRIESLLAGADAGDQ